MRIVEILEHPCVKPVSSIALNLILRLIDKSVKEKTPALIQALEESRSQFFTQEPDVEQKTEWVLWFLIRTYRDALVKILKEMVQTKETNLSGMIKHSIPALEQTKRVEEDQGIAEKIKQVDNFAARAGLRLITGNRDRYVALFKFIKDKTPDMKANELLEKLQELLALSKEWDSKISGDIAPEDEKDSEVIREIYRFIAFLTGKNKE